MPELINDGLPFRSREHAAAGLRTPYELRRAHRERRLRPVFKSVYVDARVPDSRRLRLDAAHLVTPPHAIICDCFAAWLWGVDTFRPNDRHLLTPSLLTPHGIGRVRAAGVSCRQAYLAEGDVTTLDGLRVTTPLRTACDLLRRLRRPYALAAADGMVRAGVADLGEMVDYLDELRGYPGAGQARELVQLVDPLAESPGESWQRLRIIDAGLPRPECQIQVWDEIGRERYFDMGYRQLLVATEYDGREFHTVDADRSHDTDRRSYFSHRYGWRFVIGTRERIFGTDTSYEHELGGLIGQEPLPRRW